MGRVSALSSRAVRFDGPLLNGRWKLGPKLGAGGQGQTFIARNDGVPAEPGTRLVVVKKLRLGDEGWKKFDLFEREVNVLKSLEHPGIPAFLDHFEGEKGTFYLVMGRAPGKDLSRVVAGEQRLDADELKDVLVKVLVILDYLHRQSPPIIHRDIKPANLVRSKDGALMLVDYGGVRATMQTSGGSTMVGTFGYMAPEQLHGDATPATDVFGLGATMVALACGTEPENVPRRGLRMDLDKPLRHLGPGWTTLLTAMTDPDPDTRPASARAVMELLDSAQLPRGRKRRKPGAASKQKQRARARPEPTDLAEVMPLELDVPAPVEKVLRVLLWVLGGAGYLGLSVIRGFFLPIFYTIASAFVGPDSRDGLKKSRMEAYGFLDNGRRGFRSLQHAARTAPKQLGEGTSGDADADDDDD